MYSALFESYITGRMRVSAMRRMEALKARRKGNQ
jgi:hypothetical protein